MKKYDYTSTVVVIRSYVLLTIIITYHCTQNSPMLVAIRVVSMRNTSITEEVLKHNFPRLSHHWSSRVGEDLEPSFTTYAPALATNTEKKKKRQPALYSTHSWEPSTFNNHMLATLYYTESDIKLWTRLAAPLNANMCSFEQPMRNLLSLNHGKTHEQARVLKSCDTSPSSKLSASVCWRLGESRGALVI